MEFRVHLGYASICSSWESSIAVLSKLTFARDSATEREYVDVTADAQA